MNIEDAARGRIHEAAARALLKHATVPTLIAASHEFMKTAEQAIAGLNRSTLPDAAQDCAVDQRDQWIRVFGLAIAALAEDASDAASGA